MVDFDGNDDVMIKNEGGQVSEGDDQGQVTPDKEDLSDFTALDEAFIFDLDEEDEDAGEEEAESENSQEVAEPEPTEPEKHVQTPEENAYFAELRRQREAAEREAEFQRQLEIMRQQMPETQIAQILSQHYGVSPQEMLYRLQEAQLEQEAQQLGVTPQQLRYQRQMEAQWQQQQALMQQQQQIMQMQSLMMRLREEGAVIRQKYPSITPNDLTEAVIHGYQHNALHLPLEELVRAKYAEKLFAADQQAARQEALAQVSGRMRNAIKPPTGKAPTTNTLTEEELYFARKMGVSPEDYAKHK